MTREERFQLEQLSIAKYMDERNLQELVKMKEMAQERIDAYVKKIMELQRNLEFCSACGKEIHDGDGRFHYSPTNVRCMEHEL